MALQSMNSGDASSGSTAKDKGECSVIGRGMLVLRLARRQLVLSLFVVRCNPLSCQSSLPVSIR